MGRLLSLAGFLPPHLVQSLARRRRVPEPPFVERIPAALLFSDVSGFTALTETLQRKGRLGAEEIAGVINRVFQPSIRAIEELGGSIVSFGGDALFVIFPGASPVRRAAAAAESIRRHFETNGEVHTSAGRVRLGVSQALHYGTVLGMHLGCEDRRQYLVCGPSVSALARLESRASAGDILLSRAARRQQRTERAPRRIQRRRSQVGKSDLKRYVAPHVLAVMEHFEGEYRRAAMVFFETKGFAVSRLQAFVLALFEVLERYEGILVSPDLSTMGTKWLCCFGAPVAHEDDVDRAARAAIELLKLCPQGLALRGGMHAGTLANVWVGEKSRKSFELLGDVTNTAARVAAKAAWGEVLITTGSRKALSGVLTKRRGAHAMKGKAARIQLHALQSARALAKKIRVSASMVGRDAELRRFREAIERIKAGRGSAIGLRGEAGMGKSRLKWEAAKLARAAGVGVYEGRAVSFGGATYQAIAELLRHALGVGSGASKEEVCVRVRAEAERLALTPVDRHHLADVLGARYQDSPLRHLDGKTIRLNNTVAIRASCQAIARQSPTMLVLEDMHWADEMTREAAEWLTEGISEFPLLVVLLYRPGYEAPRAVEQIELRELGEESVDGLLKAHLGAVPEKVAGLVRRRAEGNPFYVEELVRHLLETGVLGQTDEGYVLLREPDLQDVPGGVERVIAARLDRLPADVKRVVRLGALIGRSFLFDLLERLDAAKAEPGIRYLLARELVLEKAAEPLEFIFKHALTRDVAYSGILAAQRTKLHRAVAEAIESVFSEEEREGHAAMLGHHWQQAGDASRARHCYLAAARTAVNQYAHEEAAALYRAHLKLVDEPTQESIEVKMELGAKVLQVRGRVKEAEAVFREAVDEARLLGLRGVEGVSRQLLGVVLWTTGRKGEARTLNRQALAIHREVGNREDEGTVLGNMASMHREQGQMGEAEALYEQALAIHCEAGNRKLEGIVLGNHALLHAGQGRMEEARRGYERALLTHRETGNRRDEAMVLGNLGALHQDQGRLEEARKCYEQSLAIVREFGDRRIEGMALCNLALLNAEQGRFEEARRGYEHALDIEVEVGDRRTQVMVLVNLGNLHQGQRRVDEARVIYDRALAISRELGDRSYEGAVLGNLGNLQELLGQMDEARTTHEQALAIHRDLRDPRFEGFALGNLAHLELLSTGDVVRAAALASEGVGLLREVGDKLGLGNILCWQGHIALNRGESASEPYERVRRIAEELSITSESELQKNIAMLARAQATLEAGEPLICGYAPGDISSGQMEWLRKNRPDAIPTSLRDSAPPEKDSGS